MLPLSRQQTDNLRSGSDPQVRCYRSQFADKMEMLAPADQVARYLDRHECWFTSCATPMRVRPLDAQSYALTLGRFGNFGFDVEPTIADSSPRTTAFTASKPCNHLAILAIRRACTTSISRREWSSNPGSRTTTTRPGKPPL